MLERLDCDAFQCGYCTPGQICSAVAMLGEIKAGVPSHVTADLAAPPQWSSEEIRERMQRELPWDGPLYVVSATERQGTEALCRDLQNALDLIWEGERLDPDLVQQEHLVQDRMQREAREHIQALREKYLAARKGKPADDDINDEDDFDDDEDDDVEVEYVR